MKNKVIKVNYAEYGVSECATDCCPENITCSAPVKKTDDFWEIVVNGCNGRKKCVNVQPVHYDTNLKCGAYSNVITIYYICEGKTS